jgi:3-hydroxyisobutyrate dehydrogenase-like beta-hydroxyacid dehydrogenase
MESDSPPFRGNGEGNCRGPVNGGGRRWTALARACTVAAMTHTPSCIGWIGLGRIGLPMARRLLGAGHALRVWSRRPEAAQALVVEGAVAVAGPEALARQCDVVCTIVGGPDDVLSLYRRMLPCARPGAIFLEMTTASPATAARMQAPAAQAGVCVLDCPVTGGVAGAQQGQLTHFAGGDADALARSRPLLQTLATRVVHCGASGSGYRMKLINQTIVAGVLLGLADGAALARAAGFGGGEIAAALGAGTASGRLFDAYIERMVDGAGATTFTLALLRKDLQLAREDALALRSSTRLVDFALDCVAQAVGRFGTDAGVQCLAAPGAG